ncbi:MAG: aldo/keto reductase, partial [Thermoanaerobaculia bacterium]|nr:aldo/keto reductase [Thermoanaerobaculia bacterium]
MDRSPSGRCSSAWGLGFLGSIEAVDLLDPPPVAAVLEGGGEKHGDDLVRQGKVLYLGASNWAAWQVAKALGISAASGLARFECLEPMYNLVKRQAEVEILPMAISEQIGVIPYNPLAAGLLTGKYAGGADKDGRLSVNKMYGVRYSDPVYA